MDDKPLKLQPSCVNLRHKMMYVDDRQKRPGRVDDQSTTRVFWCNVTKDPLGQDGRAVTPKTCDGTRSCFCQSHETPVSLRTSI